MNINVELYPDTDIISKDSLSLVNLGTEDFLIKDQLIV